MALTASRHRTGRRPDLRMALRRLHQGAGRNRPATEAGDTDDTASSQRLALFCSGHAYPLSLVPCGLRLVCCVRFRCAGEHR